MSQDFHLNVIYLLDFYKNVYDLPSVFGHMDNHFPSLNTQSCSKKSGAARNSSQFESRSDEEQSKFTKV
jgi:hypothetical protein